MKVTNKILTICFNLLVIFTSFSARCEVSNATNWVQKSFESSQKGDWLEVIRLSNVAIRLDPNNPTAYSNRCLGYIGYNDLDSALSDCKTALSLDSTSKLATNNIALIYQLKGNKEDSSALYRKACLQGLDLACENFKKINGYSPKDLDVIIQIKLKSAVTNFKNKSWTKVIEDTSFVIINKPNLIDAYITRAGAFANSGQLNNANDDIEKALILDPNNAMAYNNLGFIKMGQGDIKNALLQYNIACNMKLNLACENIKNFNSIISKELITAKPP